MKNTKTCSSGFSSRVAPGTGVLASAFLALGIAAGPALAQGGTPGLIVTSTNAGAGNEIVVLGRDPDGLLGTPDRSFTGGDGTGAGLGNQGAVALTPDGRHLLVVNAGSDSLSVFGVSRRGLVLQDVEPSQGSVPISVTTDGNLVYVLNAGGDGNVAGFELGIDGMLQALPGSRRPLSGVGTGPAQVSLSPNGRELVVTEKATSTIVTYRLRLDGLPGMPVVNASVGMTPFGFAIGQRGLLLVSEAFGGSPDAGAVSSYELLPDGTLSPLVSSLSILETAPCWLVLSRNGRYAYTTNTGSNSITGLKVGRDGSLGLLDANGVTATTGAGPLDAAVTENGRFLYTLNSGDGTLSSFEVNANGSLTPLPGATGLPASASGLVAR